MSLPYHRGAGKDNMTYRGNSSSNSNSNSYSFGSRDQCVEETNRGLLERENDDRLAELGEQVSLLKSLTLDINNEVKSQNRLLDSMDGSFGSASDLFKNTIGKLGIMVSSGGSNHMYYLIIFVVFVFLLLYFMMSRK